MRIRDRPNTDGPPKLWDAFGPRMGEIRHVVQPGIAYGLADSMDEQTGQFDYMAGLEVERAADIPEGMVAWQVPAQTYAVFHTTLPKLGETFQHIHGQWLPQSGYRPGPGPEIELYDETFDPRDPGSVMAIYVPVEKA